MAGETAADTEVSMGTETFKDHLKDVWTDLNDRDLDGARQSLKILVDRIQDATGENRKRVREKLEDAADRFNLSFGSRD